MAQNNFHPLIIQKDDSFCIFLPEWNIAGEGKTLEDAFRQFEMQKQSLQMRSAKYQLATISTEPYPALKRGKILQDLTLFFMKTVMATFAVILIGILLLPHIGAAVRNQIFPTSEGILNRWAIDFPTKLNNRLNRITPEEEEKMREQWSKLLKRTAPMRELLRDNSK